MKIRFVLNGRPVELEVDPRETLLNVLRFGLKVRSVKRGCERGECGSCTVLLDGTPVASCLILAGQVDGHEVTTIEGLERDPVMSRLVKAFVESGAVQCGFCTPGILLTAWAGITQGRIKTPEDAKEWIGNLCRCTGYVKIVQAVYRVASGAAGDGGR